MIFKSSNNNDHLCFLSIVFLFISIITLRYALQRTGCLDLWKFWEWLWPVFSFLVFFLIKKQLFYLCFLPFWFFLLLQQLGILYYICILMWWATSALSRKWKWIPPPHTQPSPSIDALVYYFTEKERKVRFH